MHVTLSFVRFVKSDYILGWTCNLYKNKKFIHIFGGEINRLKTKDMRDLADLKETGCEVDGWIWLITVLNGKF